MGKHSRFRPSVAVARRGVAHWQARLALALAIEKEEAAEAKLKAKRRPAAKLTKGQVRFALRRERQARLAALVAKNRPGVAPEGVVQ